MLSVGIGRRVAMIILELNIITPSNMPKIFGNPKKDPDGTLNGQFSFAIIYLRKT